MINFNIYIKFYLEKNCLIKRYYDIFVILNNLIINVIEVCSDGNIINVVG